MILLRMESRAEPRNLQDNLSPWSSTLNEVEDDHGSALTRLVTFVDLVDGVGDSRQTSFSARHEAMLADGRRVLTG